MSKNNNEKLYDFEDKLIKIREKKKQIEREEKQAMVACPHQTSKGKIRIEPLNEHGDYKCRKCGATFNMNIVSDTDMKDAAAVLYNAFQQVRCFADISDDKKIITSLGELSYNLMEGVAIYKRMYETLGKGNKGKNKHKNRNNNNNDDDNFGSYGSGAISFMGKKR